MKGQFGGPTASLGLKITVWATIQLTQNGVSNSFLLVRSFTMFSVLKSYVAPNGRTTDELKRIWNEAIVAQSTYLGICMAGPRKTTKNIVQEGQVSRLRFQSSTSRIKVWRIIGIPSCSGY
jgi:hypothetical protein